MRIASISIQNLTYDPLFEDLSLDLREGDCCKIEGPSGVGKTTLLRILAHEIKKAHLRGESKITIKGIYRKEDMLTSPHAINTPIAVPIGMQYQSTLSSYAPYVSLDKQIIPPLARIKKVNPEEARALVESYMRALGLGALDLLKRKPHQISGGQLQRLDMAFLMALDPDVYLLDEPFTGLDRANAMKILGCLQDLQKQNKIVLFSSHQPIAKGPLAYKTLTIQAKEKIASSQRFPRKEDWDWIPLPQECVTLKALISKSFMETSGSIKRVLDSISILSTKENNCLGVLGTSGKGKSTLIKILAGLSDPDRGSSIEYSKPQPSKCLLFQSSLSALNPKQTMVQHFKRFEKNRVLRGMQVLGLKEEWLSRYPTEISGGQLQRFVFLKTILQAPEILLLDEPFVGLDSKQVENMVLILKYILDQKRTTMVIASHENESLENIMTQKIVIYG
jgi:ABC-type dipeptide/oligopeptide/nickel transport system ATPase subunit